MAENVKEIFTRIIHKHDSAENWQKTPDFIPLQGELIIYDRDDNHAYERFKIGDGTTTVKELPFTEEAVVLQATQVLYGDASVADILMDYIFNIDYNSMLAFDTSEIVIGETASSTTSMLGKAILGKLILG